MEEQKIGFFDAVNALFEAYQGGGFVTRTLPVDAASKAIDDIALVPVVDVLGEDVRLTNPQLNCILSVAFYTINYQFDPFLFQREPSLHYLGLAGSGDPDYFAIKYPYKDIDFESAKKDLEHIQLLMQEGPIQALQTMPYPYNPQNPLDSLEGYNVFLGPFTGGEDVQDFDFFLDCLSAFKQQPKPKISFRHRAGALGDIFCLDRRSYGVLFEHESNHAFRVLLPDNLGAVMGGQGLAYEM